MGLEVLDEEESRGVYLCDTIEVVPAVELELDGIGDEDIIVVGDIEGGSEVEVVF
jgi:hypothetical protein